MKKSDKTDIFVQQKYIELLEASNVDLHTKAHRFSKKNLLLFFVAFVLFSFSLGFVLLPKMTTKSIFAGHLNEVNFDANKLLIKDLSGKYYHITDSTQLKYIANNDLFIEIKTDEIHFSSIQKESKFKGIYQIYVPKHKQYHLFLNDGSQIQINEQSQIDFTLHRNHTPVNVDLNGEAYFKIAHNPSHPFNIQAGDMKVQVFGTEFNINNYKNNNFTQVALVNGSVKIKTPHQQQFLVPGQEATINKKHHQLLINDADMAQILDWTTDKSYFNEEKLSSICKKVEAWYQVHFIIPNKKIQNIKFSGYLNKQEGLLHFLQMLNYTENISYKINNNNITLNKI